MSRLFNNVRESLENYKFQKVVKEQVSENKQNSKFQFYARMEDLASDFKSNSRSKRQIILVELYLKYLTKLLHSILGLAVSLNSEIDSENGEIRNNFKTYELAEDTYIDLFFSDYQIEDGAKKLYFKTFSPLEIIQKLRNSKTKILEDLKEVIKALNWQQPFRTF